MVKKGYYYNGRQYSSRRAFVRQMRGMFARLNMSERRHVKPIVVQSKRVQKKQPQVTGKNWKDVHSTIEKETVLGPHETKTGTIVLQEKQQTYRINESTFEDPATHDIIRSVEAEESSRYTPSELDYHYEDLGSGTTQINATKDNRIVSSTVTTLTPAEARNQKIFYLEEKFKTWQKNPTKENRLSSKELGILAKELDIPAGGGKLKHYQSTMEQRIKRKFELQHLETQQNIDVRYRTFPQRTKSHIAKVKGKTYENSDQINALITEALEGKPRHERPEIDEDPKYYTKLQK